MLSFSAPAKSLGSSASSPITSSLVLSSATEPSASASLSTALLLSGTPWPVASVFDPHPARDAMTNPVSKAITTLFFIFFLLIYRNICYPVLMYFVWGYVPVHKQSGIRLYMNCIFHIPLQHYISPTTPLQGLYSIYNPH